VVIRLNRLYKTFYQIFYQNDKIYILIYIFDNMLDTKDWKILYELDTNARQSYSEIGKKVGLSKEVVNYRIKKLLEEDVIKGFYTVIDASKLGYINGRFFLKFQNESPKKEEEIINYFIKNKKFWWIDSIDGFRDLGVACWVKNTKEFYEEKESFLLKYKKYIEEINEAIYYKFNILTRDYLIKKQLRTNKPVLLCYSNYEEIDKIDKKILLEIADNARQEIVSIASKLNSTPTIINYRIKKMQKSGVIKGYKAMINLSKIGYYWYKIEFELSDLSFKEKLLNYCKAHPNIIYTYETIGGVDLEIELEVKSYEEFRKTLDEIKSKFYQGIKSYKHLLWYKERKIRFISEDLLG